MRVCLVVEDLTLREFHLRELRSLLTTEGFEVPLVLVEESIDTEDEVTIHSGISAQLREFLRRVWNREFIVIVNLEQKIADVICSSRTVTDQRRELEKRKLITEEVDGIDTAKIVEFQAEQASGHFYNFPDNIVDLVNENVDVVVLLGYSKIITGNILTAPKHGVLSFHGADIRKYRGRPGAFFQFIEAEEQIGLTLQQLTEELDAGRMIHCEYADISDARSWKEARYRVEQLFDSMLVTGLQKLKDPDFEPTEPDPPGRLTYSREGNKLSNVYQCLRQTIKRRYVHF